MQNRTTGMIATGITAFICGCAALLTCVWGALIATGTPIDVTNSTGTSQQTLSPTVGFALLCLSFLLILVPAMVGFFTLRKKTELMNEELPPTS